MKFNLIIGLGNNDPQYAATYHNVGHLFVDYLAAHYPGLRAKKTSGYMNESGASARDIMKKNSAAPEHTLVAHDESDLAIGTYKISSTRGAAGHKGVQSVFDVTHANTFTRLRIGIRPKTDLAPRQKAESSVVTPRIKAGQFVLKTISDADRKILMHVFEQAAAELFGAPEC